MGNFFLKTNPNFEEKLNYLLYFSKTTVWAWKLPFNWIPPKLVENYSKEMSTMSNLGNANANERSGRIRSRSITTAFKWVNKGEFTQPPPLPFPIEIFFGTLIQQMSPHQFPPTFTDNRPRAVSVLNNLIARCIIYIFLNKQSKHLKFDFVSIHSGLRPRTWDSWH